MTIKRSELIAYALLFLYSGFLVFDLFSQRGLSATFDGRMHATMIAQFTQAFRDGEIHVTWSDGFGNYGMPMGLIHQQVIVYLGGFLNLFLNNTVLATNIVLFLGAFLSAVFYYRFLRIYFSAESAFLGAFLFNFSSYRIFNLYVRGAYPEYLASVFLPLLLIGLHSVIVSKNKYAMLLIAFSTAGIILCHPFTLIIYSFIFIPYMIFLLSITKNKLKLLTLSLVSICIGVLLTAYYFVPLVMEMKYFYYGNTDNHIVPGQFLSFQNYFLERWHYFYQDNPFVRGNILTVGLIETIAVLSGVGVLFYSLVKKRQKQIGLISFAVASALFLVFFSTSLAEIFYKSIPTLSNIQYPWRMLSGLMFISPLFLAFIVNKLPKDAKAVTVIVLIIIISFLRFPQLYGKNFTVYPESYFYKTTDNVAAVVLNPIWTGVAEDYPVKTEKIEIIEGNGAVLSYDVSNSKRHYKVLAEETIKVVDNTFYFPGWKLYVDGSEHIIEYQDPAYRGVITYTLHKGTHDVLLQFENTKVRTMGILLSGGALCVLILELILMKYKKTFFV